MYEVFYNFKAEPFRLSPDHKFCFEHKGYAKARAYMAYAFKRAEGFVMITGRPGTGKTTLIGELVESLSKDKVCTANLVCTQLQADDLLRTVGYSFGIGSAKVDKAELLQRLTVLLHRWHREGRRALLIVDEAQDLSSSAMEELRLLTNIQIGGQPLLQIFLLGQPELRDLILSTEMEQVHQRIVAASHIEGLGVEETEAYVVHRLTVVGWRGDPAIDRAIFPLIHKFSEGIPRRINLICSRLFLLGSVEQRHAIGVEDVRVVISELQAENLAAGTGFSEDDFDQTSVPEWVPIPAGVSAAPAAHRLHVVDNEQIAAIDEEEFDSPRDAKKKDLPGLTPFSSQIPDNHSASLGASSVYFEDESEYDQDIENLPVSESINSESDWIAPLVSERNFVPETIEAIESRPSWRRSMLVGSLVAAALVLVFFLTLNTSTWGVGSSTVRKYLAGETADHAPATTAQLPPPEYTLSDGFDEEEISAPSIRSADSSDAAPAVSSVKTEASVSRAAQAALADSDMPTPSYSVDTANQNELASTSISSAENVAERVSESTKSTVDSETTFLINFSFDSDALIPDSHTTLDNALTALQDNPESVAAITGFTDNQGDEEYNLALSRKRADAVEQYLVAAGIARDRLRVEGRGVLTESDGVQFAEREDSLEPYRIVQIKVSSDGLQ